jgi:hypothetical protein
MFDLINTDPFLVFFGSFYLVMGLSVFFARDAWKEFMVLFTQNDAVNLIMGIITLPISLFVVVFYNDWDGTASALLMVLGYLGLAKSFLLLLKPRMAQDLMKRFQNVKPFWLPGGIAILVGAALLVL